MSDIGLCKYCRAPELDDGSTSHALPCAGLETVQLTRLQMDEIERLRAELERVKVENERLTKKLDLADDALHAISTLEDWEDIDEARNIALAALSPRSPRRSSPMTEQEIETAISYLDDMRDPFGDQESPHYRATVTAVIALRELQERRTRDEVTVALVEATRDYIRLNDNGMMGLGLVRAALAAYDAAQTAPASEEETT